jgi:hypothetical protein
MLDDREIEELIGRDWTVELTLAEIEQYERQSGQTLRFEVAAKLATLCGLTPTVSHGLLEIRLRPDGPVILETSNPNEALDWIDGYAMCLNKEYL